MRFRRFAAVFIAIAATGVVLRAALPAAPGMDAIQAGDLQRWLTYVASDDLEGRGNFSEGLGLAAGYIEEQLNTLGVKPGGDQGTYFEQVKVQGVKTTSHSSITVEVNGRRRTFKDGDGIEFPKNVGGRRTFTVDDVEFVGYGVNAPAAKINDYANKDVKGKVVVWLGANGPAGIDRQQARRILGSRNRYATEMAGAAGVIGPQVQMARGGRGPETSEGPGERPDFTTVQRLDDPVAPAVSVTTGGDAFWEFLLSGSDVKYANLKASAEAQDPLPSFRVKGAKVTFNLDADYKVIRAQLTHNIVGIIEGSDPALKNTYVEFGAHYDHVGYAETDPADSDGQRLPGRVTKGAEHDRVWNGADDDGSGSVALLAIGKAFMAAPRPKRSIRLVWFTGEERGLWGSRFDAEFGPVPEIVAQLNIDMIGRNRDDKQDESNTVYLIGSDRISTELHNLNVVADAMLPEPLKLDYEFNDPADPENLYFRSDHYSYASKGIPIIFFTTGLHPDYHATTDSVEKIQFPKMTRIVQLIYETGRLVADLDHAPVRDNKGPRVGKGSSGKLPVTPAS